MRVAAHPRPKWQGRHSSLQGIPGTRFILLALCMLHFAGCLPRGDTWKSPGLANARAQQSHRPAANRLSRSCRWASTALPGMARQRRQASHPRAHGASTERALALPGASCRRHGSGAALMDVQHGVAGRAETIRNLWSHRSPSISGDRPSAEANLRYPHEATQHLVARSVNWQEIQHERGDFAGACSDIGLDRCVFSAAVHGIAPGLHAWRAL
jgi:hypothetical protein